MARLFVRGNIIWIGYYNNGWQRESLKLENTKANRKLADELRLQKELELKRRQFSINTNNLLLTEAFYQFLVSKNLHRVKDNVYYSAMKLFAEFLGNDTYVKNIKTIHLKNFEQYLKSKKKSSNTIFTYLNHLSIFSRWMLQEGFIDKDFSYKSKPHKKQAMIIPDLALRKLLLYLYFHSKEQYYLIRFLYLTGFRKSEALNLQWSQIDLVNNTIYVENTKAKRTDVFPVYPELKKLLSTIPKTHKKLFRYSTDGLKFYNRALTRLNLNHYSLHDLRRKFGTNMAQRGLSPYELQKVMRHENIKTTMQYYINVDMKNIADKM